MTEKSERVTREENSNATMVIRTWVTRYFSAHVEVIGRHYKWRKLVCLVLRHMTAKSLLSIKDYSKPNNQKALSVSRDNSG